MRVMTVLLLGLLVGCSGERSTPYGGGGDPSSVDGDEGTDGDDGADGDDGSATPKPAPRQVSLEAAGGEASSAQHRMRFRVVAPIMVAGGRLRSNEKGAQ